MEFLRFLPAMALLPAAALAQTTGIPDMQEIARGLGVKCEYCHAGMGGRAAESVQQSTPSHIEIAKAMIAMTRDLNEKIQAATGKPPNQTIRVACITCHRGVAVPGQLSDILAKTALENGPEAAVAQYRDLRAQYYGHQSYDFGEETLLAAAERVVRAKPPASIPLLHLNLEFYPKSVRSYTQIAFAYTRTLDDESAIAALEKALEIEPENGMVRGQLEQLKSYRRRK
ncbi:MAG TPA: photosynthetic reaction center cytochrome c subunit family protein [Bryobacteraceae bacterium]|nr:photosynthetic reaction center cytochrome c subunit family protein [Bryobacteraceae bacterium]